jgi:hypothetical protein
VSNASIVNRMREACDQWEAGQIDSVELGLQIAGLACALEGVGRHVAAEGRDWELELAVASDDAKFGEYDRALAQVREVIVRIRAWIDGLDIA